MEHLTLIGRYYERLEDKNYADILELKVNNFEDLSQCNFSYLSNNTFYDVTYESLVKTINTSSSIKSNSSLYSDTIIILHNSLVLNNSSLLMNNIINRKGILISLNNISDINIKSSKFKITNANIKCINSLSSTINNRLHVKSNINNTSNIASCVNTYTKRVKRKYFTLEINKSHFIEVII